MFKINQQQRKNNIMQILGRLKLANKLLRATEVITLSETV